MTKPLQVPHLDSPAASRNFIQIAACELKFPTLLEFGPDRAAILQKRIKPTFPLYERAESVSVGPNQIENEHKHIFRTRDGAFAVAFKPDTIAIDALKYDSWEHYCKGIELAVAAVRDLIDSSFFTRIGLRYVNRIPAPKEELSQWISSSLLGALTSEALGDLTATLQEIRGRTDFGSFTLKHGYKDPEDRKVEYLLDIDCYAENIEVESYRTTLQKLHDIGYDLFHWSLGPAAKRLLAQ